MRTLPNDPRKLDKSSKIIQRFYNLINKAPIIPSAGRYNLTISHEKQFIWFRVAKVGTRTILNHLRESDIKLDADHAMRIRYPLKPCKDYFKFAFVRNPYERLASCWRDKVVNLNYFHFDETQHEKLKNFGNFVDWVATLDITDCDHHLRAQTSLIDMNMIDYLGRMETFNEDVEYIFKRLGLPEREISQRNVTSAKKGYQENYTEELAKKVSLIYRKDIQVLGYQF